MEDSILKKESTMSDVKEKRQFERYDLKCRMKYQVTTEGNLSDLIVAESRNISQAGVLITTNSPMMVGSVILVEVEKDSIADLVELDQLKDYAEESNGISDVVRIYGTVMRCEKFDDDSYGVGIHLINQ